MKIKDISIQNFIEEFPLLVEDIRKRHPATIAEVNEINELAREQLISEIAQYIFNHNCNCFSRCCFDYDLIYKLSEYATIDKNEIESKLEEIMRLNNE